MNRSMVYILKTRLKNQIKTLVQSPSKLIYVIIILALVVLSMFQGNQLGERVEFRSIKELCAIVTLFYGLIFLIMLAGGFTSGGTVFKMPDVNFLFTSPATPMKVLAYGIVQQMATSLLMGLFIPFQYGWMHGAYGIGFWDIFVIFIGYGITVFCAQLLAMVIYIVISGSEKRRRITRLIYVLIPSAWAVWLLVTAFSDRTNIIANVANAATSIPMHLLPVAGYAGAITGGIMTGDALPVALGVIQLAAAGLIVGVYLKRTKPDYYEDVLQSTETAFNAQADVKEGKIKENAPKKIRLGGIGLAKGSGASVFYYKHKLENRRANMFVLSGVTILFAVIILVFSLFMTEFETVLPSLSFGVYMQLFSIGLGRFVREMTKPYIYLVPEPAFKKLFWSMLEGFGGYVLEAAVIYVPLCIIMGTGPACMAAVILARVSCSFLMLAANLATERIFGHITVKMFMMLFYILIVMLMFAPGVILGVVLTSLGAVLVSMDVTICLAMTLCNIPMFLLVTFLCRNIFDTGEFRY